MKPPFAFDLCADDYAMTPGVSRGILEALDAGALSATSVMTTSPWWPESASGLAPHTGRASIGLHLNLTLGAPLGAMPRLAPGAILPGIGALLRLARGRAFPADEVAGEIDRQLQRFIDVFGLAPDHVDGHQHVHVLSSIRPLLFEALARRGWHPAIRDSADRPLRILRRRTSMKKALGLAFLAQGLAADAKRRGLTTNEGFSGFSAFDPEVPYRDLFCKFLRAPGPRHLVMCHPGYVDDALRRLDPVVETREQELAFLTSPDFNSVLLGAGATLRRLR